MLFYEIPDEIEQAVTDFVDGVSKQTKEPGFTADDVQ